MDYVQEFVDKLVADPERYIALLRRQNALHCVWHLELQRRIDALEGTIDDVASVMEGYATTEVASGIKLHRYAQKLREGLSV